MNASISDAYWNKCDCDINHQFLHTTPVVNSGVLSNFYKANDITRENYNKKLNGISRYMISNNGESIGETLQGSVYDAIDLLTGRRVIIKASNKELVRNNMSKYNTRVEEDIRKEAKLLHKISDKITATDAGMYMCTYAFVVLF